MKKQSQEIKGLECYHCGVKLTVNEAICHNRGWDHYPIISCNGTTLCRSDEADEHFVNTRIEEEYRRIVQQHKDCEEFTRQKQAYQAKHGPNALFMIFGGADPCF